MTKTQKRHAAAATRYAILTVWALIVAFPLYWMVTTSFKPSDQWFSWPPVYFPSPPTLENYRDVWLGATTASPPAGSTALSLQTPFVALRNSLILAFGATTLAVLYGVDHRLRRFALSAVVRNPHVPAADAAHGAADRHRGAAVAVLFLYRPARFDGRARRRCISSAACPTRCG